MLISIEPPFFSFWTDEWPHRSKPCLALFGGFFSPIAGIVVHGRSETPIWSLRKTVFRVVMGCLDVSETFRFPKQTG